MPVPRQLSDRVQGVFSMSHLPAEFFRRAFFVRPEDKAAPAAFFVAPGMITVVAAGALGLRTLVIVVIHRVIGFGVFLA